MNLVATTVLHDARSNDWDSDRPFYEGQKVSHSIQVISGHYVIPCTYCTVRKHH